MRRHGSSGVFAVLGDGLSHVGIGLHVAHPVVIHYTEIAAAEGFGHGERNLGLGLDEFGLHRLYLGLIFLLHGDGCCPADFGLGLGDFLVGGGLGCTQFCPAVFAEIDVGDVD